MKIMANVKDISNKYKAGSSPGGARKTKGQIKKQFDKAMRQVMTIAEQEGMAIVGHNDKLYTIVRNDKVQEAVNNAVQMGRFQLNVPPDMKKFQESHQEVLAIMSKLDYEELGRDQFDTDEDFALHQKIVRRNADLFDDIDQFTFKFSSGYQKNKTARKEILDNYKEFRANHPEIEEILDSKVNHVV